MRWFRLKCESYNNICAGQTGRTLERRLKKNNKRFFHLCSPLYTTSAIAEDAINTGHMTERDRAKVLEICYKEYYVWGIFGGMEL